MKLKRLMIIIFAWIHIVNSYTSHDNKSIEYVTIAILAKDKAHVLPLYLSCIEAQTWPAHKTYLYIRTNNNNDATAQILKDWVAHKEKNYAGVYFDDTDVSEPVQEFKQHEWNYTRCKVLGKIRQDSVNWAKIHNSHYFVVDCDNFIYSDTLESLLSTNQAIIAPFLRCCSENFLYSNYHYAIDSNGYYAKSDLYFNVLNQEVKGIIEVPVIHCTYLVRNEVLDKIYYDDDSGRYEYVIFSDSARKQSIPQYLDNRKIYGYLTFAETEEDVQKEELFSKFFTCKINQELK